MPIQLADGSTKKKRKPSAFSKQIDDYERRQSGGSAGSSRNSSDSGNNFTSATQGPMQVNPSGMPVQQQQQLDPVMAQQAFQNMQGQPQQQQQLDPVMAQQAFQNMQRVSFGDKVKSRLQSEAFATTGISFGGYKPPEGTEFTSIQIPAANIGRIGTTAIKSSKDLIFKQVKNAGRFRDFVTRTITESSRTIRTVNPATGKESIRIVTETGRLLDGGNVIKAAIALGALALTIGTSKGFAEFISKPESQQTLQSAYFVAQTTNNPELLREAIAIQNEILTGSDGFWGDLTSWIPGYNVANAVSDDFAQSMQLSQTAWEALADDMEERINEGVTEEEQWSQRITERQEAESNWTQEWIAAKQIILDLEAEARRENRAEEAQYWSEQLAEKSRFEERERERQLEYWEAYFKLKAKFEGVNVPSKLGFGLL